MAAAGRKLLFQSRLLCSCYVTSRNAVMSRGFKTCKVIAAQPLAAPAADNAPKSYPPNIQQIVDQICKLSLIEVAELNDLLKKTLKIDDSQLVSHSMVASAPAKKADDAEPAKETRTSFTVKLLKVDETKKVAAIKAVKSLIEGMNLVQAKKFVESAPQVVRADIGKEEAEKIKKQLEEGGAVVEIV